MSVVPESRPVVTAQWLLENLVVCMLFFNKLEQTIESSSSFLAAGVRVNLLNNGSEPAALEALKAHFSDNPRVTILDAGSNRGVSGGRNLQITGTNAPWLLFVDNDITVETENWVDSLVEAMNRSPLADIFVPRLFNKHEDAWGWLSDFVVDGYGNCAFIRTDAPFANAFPGGASVVSRRVFERVGLYDEDLFVGFEDFELAIRAWKKGRPLLVRAVEDVVLIHDHRVSLVAADKSAALVRYNFGHIRKSHTVIKEKHGVLLDPNFADWLKEQVHQLTGERTHDVEETAQSDGNHALHGFTVAPHFCGDGLVRVIVDGRGADLWMRLRAIRIACDSAREAQLKVLVSLVDAPVDMAREALRLGLADHACSFEEWRSTEAQASVEGADMYLYVGPALLTSGFIVKAFQHNRFDVRVAGSILHPERVIRASSNGLGEQLVLSDVFDPSALESSLRCFPAFAMPSSIWGDFVRSDLLSWVPGHTEAMTCWIERSCRDGVIHRGVPGSAAIIKICE